MLRRDIEVLTVFCPNRACASRDLTALSGTGEVAVYRESGQAELLEDMPPCPTCGTEMLFLDDLKAGSGGDCDRTDV